MPPIMSREIRLSSRPKGRPKADHFTLATVAMDPPNKGHVLVRNTYLSIDPCLFCRMRGGKSVLPPYELDKPLDGGAVGTVIESRSAAFKPGDVVISNYGWRECFVAHSHDLQPVSHEIHPISSYLGVLGLHRAFPWADSYVGHANTGRVLLVSGAAGETGSVASLLANLRGCRLIGSAGSRAMIDFLREDCGFDVAFDYKAGPILEQLNQDASPFDSSPNSTSLEAALGVCMAGSFVAKATPGFSGCRSNFPLPVYFLSQEQELAS